MAQRMEQQLARVGGEVGARVDAAMDRVHDAVERLRGRLDDLKVQAGLAKLEARDRAEPVVEELRELAIEARVAVDDLRTQLERDHATYEDGDAHEEHPSDVVTTRE